MGLGLGREAFGGGGRKEERELYLTAPIAKLENGNMGVVVPFQPSPIRGLW